MSLVRVVDDGDGWKINHPQHSSRETERNCPECSAKSSPQVQDSRAWGMSPLMKHGAGVDVGDLSPHPSCTTGSQWSLSTSSRRFLLLWPWADHTSPSRKGIHRGLEDTLKCLIKWQYWSLGQDNDDIFEQLEWKPKHREDLIYPRKIIFFLVDQKRWKNCFLQEWNISFQVSGHKNTQENKRQFMLSSETRAWPFDRVRTYSVWLVHRHLGAW